MVARIRAQIRRAPPSADDSYLAAALVAVDTVKREAFVPRPLRHQAYTEKPLPIGYEQTISDPYIVAVMTAVLKLPQHSVVLDVGTGSGYQAAVLGHLADRVYSIEIVKSLADSAALRLASLGYANVVVRDGNGYADFVLIPTKTAIFDIMSMTHTLEVVRQLGRDFAVVLTFVSPQGQEAADGMHAWESWERPSVRLRSVTARRSSAPKRRARRCRSLSQTASSR